MAASRLLILRAGSGNRALPGARPGRSAANVTSSSGALAIARRHEVTARLNGSVGASLDPVRNLEFDVVIAISSRVVPSPPSSQRTQGPITTDDRCCPAIQHCHPTEISRSMGPCFRRDNDYESATFTADSGSSWLKQR